VEPFLDTSQSHITPDHWTIPFYTLTFPKELDPPVARSLAFKVYAKNLLGEETELILGDDFSISNQTGAGFILNGSTLTEEIQTSSKSVNGNTVYYPE
jgi:hypothetical protein